MEWKEQNHVAAKGMKGMAITEKNLSDLRLQESIKMLVRIGDFSSLPVPFNSCISHF